MAKKKQAKPKREMTKRQLSGWQKQQKRQRLIFSAAVFVVAAVFLVIGLGWYLTDYRPRQETVLIADGVEVKMAEYLKALKYYGGGNPDSLGRLGMQILTRLEENELIKRGAGEELGIGVSDQEVEAEATSRGLGQEYRELVKAELLERKVLEHFEAQTPQYAEQRHVLAMFLESESKALAARDSIEAGDDFGEVAGMVSVDSYTRRGKGDLGFQIKEVLALPSILGSEVASEHAFSMEVGTLSQPVLDEGKVKVLGYWLIKVLEKHTDPVEVHIHGILLGSMAEAEAVEARLKSGEDFAALAAEFSQDKDSRDEGGDMGWFSVNSIRPVFKPFALEQEVVLDEVSGIISDSAAVTTGGCWLFKVLEKDDNREVSADSRALLAGAAYDDWLFSLRTKPGRKTEILIDQAQISWAVETAVRELSR